MTDDLRRPRLVVFDVNETLSDMSPLGRRFADTGAPAGLARTWFAGLLRDGFALTVTGGNPEFSALARTSLRSVLGGLVEHPDAGVDHIMAGFGDLPLHPDVEAGIRALQHAGVELVTLSNGATSVAQGLFERAGIADAFSRLLSVQDAPLWKPAGPAYEYALQACDVEAADALLVAVHPWDIHGAHAAGMATAWLNRDGGTYPDYFHRPDLEARALTELASQLSDLPS